jgi:hypothetical protein
VKVTAATYRNEPKRSCVLIRTPSIGKLLSVLMDKYFIVRLRRGSDWSFQQQLPSRYPLKIAEQ